MSALESYGMKDGPRTGYSKLDVTIAEMPEEDSKTLVAWLHDPRWTDNAIADAICDWAKDNGRRELACRHGVVKRWRELRDLSSAK